MDFTFHLGGRSSGRRNKGSGGDNGDGGSNTTSTTTTPMMVAEEYDPSQPLDSSEEEEEAPNATLNFEKSNNLTSFNFVQGGFISNNLDLPAYPSPTSTLQSSPQQQLQPSPQRLSHTSFVSVTTNNDTPELDLSSIPMPSDEYRRPTIQFSIPTRHRLMSISTLIKRQKGVMKKADKGNGGGLNFNSEVSKAFQKGGGGGGDGLEFSSSQDGIDPNEEDYDKPKMSLVHEIFGSDDEEPDNDLREDSGGGDLSQGPTAALPSEDLEEDDFVSNDVMLLPPLGSEELSSLLSARGTEDGKWKTVAETVQENLPLRQNRTILEQESLVEGVDISNSATTPPLFADDIIISIKPSSELLGNSSSNSPEIAIVEEYENQELLLQEEEKSLENEDLRGKENKQIVLECVSDTDDDFEVTFVGMGRANLVDLRQGRLSRRNPSRKKSDSPVNGFEEGEIVESDKRKNKRDKKKKKTKKRKRSKDSRVSGSTKVNSERSRSSERADSVEERNKSLSDSDKEVSWRKPKLTKSRNYRNGKRESEERVAGDRDRNLERDDPPTRRRNRSRSLNRYSSSFSALKNKSRRRRSISRHRSRSKSVSRSPLSRRNNRSRGPKRTRRDGSSYRSRSFGSNHSSPSHSRSRSLTKRKFKRHHSPSPMLKHHRHRSISLSPVRPSNSPSRPRKSNRSVDVHAEEKLDKASDKTSPVSSAHSARKLSKSDASASVSEDSKKKPKKDKVVPVVCEDADKEKKKKKKRREKSLSPVKAIVADGDSIVVSLSFQKSKEEPTKSLKSSTAHNNRSSDIENRGNNNAENSDEIEPPVVNYKPTPRKGTILINLNSSPNHDNEHKKSPDGSPSEEKSDRDVSKKSQEDEQGQDTKSDTDSESTRRTDGHGRLDFVSSSHENSVDNTHSGFSSTPKKSDSPPEKLASAIASRNSPYKFGEFFVTSTCDSKSMSPSLDISSPKILKPNELPESSSATQKSTRNSPFENLRSNSGNENNGPEKPETPSPEIFTPSSAKPPPTMKPMIGNIPGLFPSGFSVSNSTPSVIIPAPPKIVPNSAPSSLINNLVSVATALYAPLLAAKQPNQTTNSGSLRHNQSNSSASKHGRNNGQGETDSPFSPNSSDGDDLFEPPSGDGSHGKEQGNFSKKNSGGGGDQAHNRLSGPAGNSTNAKYGNDSKRSLFDSLFAPATQKPSVSSKSHGKQKKGSRDSKRGKHRRSSKRTDADKNGEMEMNSRLNEDVPNSAVALKINEKYLKKLNRQERVVEEVKCSLKPHYIKKHITKEEYKDILRKAVPKICHNKSGEINPHKIKELVEAYVKKYKKSRKSDGKIS